MSALPSAAVSRPFIFDARKAPQSLLDRLSDFPKLSGVAPASRLEVRPAPEMVTSGIREVDALTGGLPRGCLTEICGPASSGRTTLLLAALAAATERGEVGALIDAGDTLDPLSAAAAGIDLNKLLWVRCGEKKRSADKFSRTSSGTSARISQSPRRSPDYSVLDQVLRITDLLLQSNGFGLIALDLGDISTRAARRIPLASWFRFRRAIETTSTVMLVIEQLPIAGSCSSLLLRLQDHKPSAARALPSHCRLFETLHITLELERTRLERKPPRNPQTILRTQPAWAVS
jgi:RecA DNA recombination protein